MYQEVDTALIPYLSVTENILLDQIVSAGRKGFMNWPSLHKEAESILQSFGFSIPVRMLVEECTLSEKQLILIARATVQKRSTSFLTNRQLR